jgi:hypothetical protein
MHALKWLDQNNETFYIPLKPPFSVGKRQDVPLFLYSVKNYFTYP